MTEQHWKVRKDVDYLRAGDRFIFEDWFGGEGEILTATGPAQNLMGTRVVGTEELDFDLEFVTTSLVRIAVDTEARYGLTDDITTCPRCGSRTDFVDTGGPDDEQEHACLSPTCRYVFIGFFDPEDFDADGNFIDTEEDE
jgi:hypothetical protein